MTVDPAELGRLALRKLNALLDGKPDAVQDDDAAMRLANDLVEEVRAAVDLGIAQLDAGRSVRGSPRQIMDRIRSRVQSARSDGK